MSVCTRTLVNRQKKVNWFLYLVSKEWDGSEGKLKLQQLWVKKKKLNCSHIWNRSKRSVLVLLVEAGLGWWLQFRWEMCLWLFRFQWKYISFISSERMVMKLLWEISIKTLECFLYAAYISMYYVVGPFSWILNWT